VLPPDPDHAVVTFLPVAVPLLTRVSLVGSETLAGQQSACHFASASSGRIVRALIASLLL
jgi:hypothetical protein